MNFNKLVLASISFVTGMLMLVFPLQAKVEGDKIILGSAISLTGKYATNGLHAQRGYDFAVERINSMGGVKVGGKTIIMVEQNAKKGLEFADIGYVLVAGELALAGNGNELLENPEVGRLFLGG